MFWVVTACLVLLPFSMSYKLLLFGVRTHGFVVPICSVDVQQAGYCVATSKSIIQFEADGVVVRMYGPENFEYNEGEVVDVVYLKDSPTTCMVYSLGALFVNPKSAVAGVLLIVWLAFYFAFRDKRKPSAGLMTNDKLTH